MNDLRAEVRAWLEEHWDPELSVDEWWSIVAEAGWTAPHLPVEQGGRDLSRSAGASVRAAFAELGALRPPGGNGLAMAAPTILAHGTQDQIARHVRPVLQGRVSWCQLFSEPGAGSDLAGLTTRAERDGSRWIINGQKVWSSMAMAADRGMLLARTNFEAPKHKGISWFAFPLDQAGVTIRPLRQMNGEAEFSEVFLDDAVVDDVDLIGGEGNGWTVAQTTLRFERSGIGAGGGKFAFPVPGPKGGLLGMRAGDAARIQPPHRDKAIQFRELLEMAIALGRADDVLIRQKLAQLHTLIRIGDWNALRARADASRGGLPTIANLGKIAQSRIMKLSAALGADIVGADGMLAAPHGPEGGRFAGAMLFSPAWSIAGGTDEIQRNIIGERALGLPRESSPERDMAYGEFLRTVGTSTR